MGQVYSVTATLIFNNEEDKGSARMALVDFIKNCMEDGTRFDTMKDGDEQIEFPLFSKIYAEALY